MKYARIDEISDALGVSKQAARKRANKEEWKSSFARGKGGNTKQFLLQHLPEDVRMALAQHKATVILSSHSQAATEGAIVGTKNAKAKLEQLEKQRIAAEARLAAFGAIPPENQAIAYARRDILLARDNYFQASGINNVKKGTAQFCHLYNSGEIRIGDHIKNQVKKVSWSTLSRWQSTFNSGGLAALVPGYHNPKKGTSQLSPEQRDFLLGMITKHPHIKYTTLQMALEARFAKLPGNSAIRRFVSTWRKENESLILYVTNPDKWRNKHQFAVGSASEHVVKLNQVWEFDSTPADVMLADGRYCLIGVIDVYSRRLKLHVSKTSRATAVSALIRKTLLDWGKPEIAKTDNGADYISNHIVQVFDDLDIEQILCPPFTPEAKPHIERAFKTFAHSFQELMPNFIGHSVADRKDIEARNSFASRIMGKNCRVEITMTAEELQTYCDRWTESIYHQNRHRNLNNRTPLEVARAWKDTVKAISNERALDILLAEAPKNKGVRTITKDGVSVDKITYISDWLPEPGTQVRVKIDPIDLGTIYLFDVNGPFLSVAQDPLRTGLNRAETAMKLKHRQNKLIKQGAKELKKIAREQALDEIHEEILDYRESQAANIIELPQKREEISTPALDEAAKAVGELDIVNSEESAFDQLILDIGDEELASIDIPKEEKIFLLRSDSDQYDLIRSETKGGKRKLTQKEYTWLTEYYETATGRTYMALEGDLREKVGLDKKQIAGAGK